MDTSYGLVILYKDMILLCHPTNARWWGTYTIPKGHADDETPKSAAIRETFEEIGIKIPKKWLDGKPLFVDYITKKKRLYYWVVRLNNLSDIGLDSLIIPKKQLQLKEISWAGFISKKDAEKRIMVNQKPLLSHLTMKIFESFKEINESLTQKEIDFLDEVNQYEGYGILRKMLGTDEIKIANRLVKMGYLDKGISDDKSGGVAYFATRKGRLYLRDKQ